MRFSYKIYHFFSSLHYRTQRRFTKPGLLVLGGIVLTLGLGADTERSAGYQLLAVLFGLLITAMFWAPFFRARFTVQRHLPRFGTVDQRHIAAFARKVVGGAGAHWNGVTWRWPDHELRIRTKYEERYGKNFVPADMPIQDWGITGAEIEPYYDKFEYTAGVSGKAGNLKGQVQPGGNPFEDPRSRNYPNPALVANHASKLFSKAATDLGYHPFPRPTANSSQPYTNPDGMILGQCQYCGFCERFGCEANAKGSPHITVIPVALRNPNVELRTYCWATKVIMDSTGKKATGVAYVNMLTGEEIEQPADLVILAAYGLSNVHLMLLSGIGKPYYADSQTGVIGKNYAYQGGSNVALFFEGTNFNPFIATGGWGASIDDFHTNWNFDATLVTAVTESVTAVTAAAPDVTTVTALLLASLIEAAGGNVAPGAVDVAPIQVLLAHGCDLDLDVLPVVREIAKSQTPIKRWDHPGLIRAILRGRDIRIAPKAPLPSPPSRQHSPGVPRFDMDELVAGYRAGNVDWDTNRLGPPPGAPGCRVDASILRENGY
jgi:hypothetical protein